jgi:hypothetical protein
VRPKAAVAANTGAGPDIILSTNDDANLYPDKLLDVTDVAEYIGKKYGGWYPAGQAFLKPDGKKWLGLPLGAAGSMMVYRESQLKAAGFDAFPKTTDDFLKMAKAVAAKGTPGGMALGNATGDGLWCNWLVWAFGGKLGRRQQQGRHRQPGDAEGARVRQGALRDLHSRGRCPGSTRTTTRPSSTARSRTPTTASRSTSPPRTRPIRRSRRWLPTSSTRRSPSGRSACRRSRICSSTR